MQMQTHPNNELVFVPVHRAQSHPVCDCVCVCASACHRKVEHNSNRNSNVNRNSFSRSTADRPASKWSRVSETRSYFWPSPISGRRLSALTSAEWLKRRRQWRRQSCPLSCRVIWLAAGAIHVDNSLYERAAARQRRITCVFMYR